MEFYFFIKHLLFALVIAVFSAAATVLLIRHLRAFDVPNERSSHTRITPRGGGLSIASAFLVGISLIHIIGDKTPIFTHYFIGFLFSSFVLATISLYDDFHTVSFRFKLAGQVVAILVGLSAGIVIDEVHLPVLGTVDFGLWAYPLTFFWILCLTNAYNFIDGLDGLAASTALVASLFLAYVSFNQGSHFIYLASLSLAAASSGFLIFNWSPAKIFMGDVGSTFLGFTFAVMAVIAARYDHSHTSLFVVPLLLFHIIFDTAYTFFRRLRAGENVFSAHRAHLYQLINRLGYSHRQVSLAYAFMAFCQGLTAVWMTSSLGEERVYIYLPFTFLYLAGARWVMLKAVKKGLL
ncbi:MAG: MraY family glycosyltransferase [Gallionella sp.]|nr:MraY family glycosyltransferase [Gallionella sp.]